MTEHAPGSASRPLRVAIVGSGPSAFYAAEALFRAKRPAPAPGAAEPLAVRIDMIERLPTPFGLVRGGVAPDHQKIKSVTAAYEKTAQNPCFRFFGNVMLGRDLEVADLKARYDAIVYAVGNESERTLGVPGEDANGVHSATSFVGWYNGHPDYRDARFDLENATRVAVIGNGNVAMDVTRILAKDPEALAGTDVAGYALDALRKSRVREILLVGRRGPAQAAFSPKEIQEIADLDEADLVVAPDEVELDPVSRRWLEQDVNAGARKNLEILQRQAERDRERVRAAGTRRTVVRCMFLRAPVGFAESDGRVAAVRFERGELYEDGDGIPRPRGTGTFHDEPVQLVFEAIGYRGVPIRGVPFDDAKGIVPNAEGRVLEAAGMPAVRRGEYVVGWAKRGPTGLIGTNSPDSKSTVAKILEDLDRLGVAGADDLDAIPALLRARGVDFVTLGDWRKLDAFEVEAGKRRGKVREKLASVAEMMATVRKLRKQEE